MHIAIALVRMGVPCDHRSGRRQRTFAHYIENRAAFASRSGHALPMPSFEVVERTKSSRPDADADEAARSTTL